MPDHGVTEEPLRFGEGQRLSGVLTTPGATSKGVHGMPVFVFLNAGLLHRVGPYGLYVRFARTLAEMGFSSLRFDLAGKGDSPGRPGLTTAQSVAADFDEVVSALASRLGPLKLVLAGLCSGADDSVRLAIRDERVIGMLLLDPVCSQDDGFNARTRRMKYTNLRRYLLWLKRRFNILAAMPGESNGDISMVNPLALRDSPSHDQLRAAFQSICERRGRVLSIFTQYALGYYNQLGQMGRTLDVVEYNKFCSEIFWPDAEHTYALEIHRRRLVEEFRKWAADFRSHPWIYLTRDLMAK